MLGPQPALTDSALSEKASHLVERIAADPEGAHDAQGSARRELRSALKARSENEALR